MRISARLKASGTSLKLKDENFLTSISSLDDIVDEIVKGDIDEESDLEDIEEEGSDFDDKSVVGSSPKKSKTSASKAAKPKNPKKTPVDSKPAKPARKKLKRIGGYVPPSVTEIKEGKLLLSREEWTKFIAENNSSIKRRNRWIRTVMRNDILKEPPAKIAFSSFTHATPSPTKTPLVVTYKIEEHSLVNDHLSLDGNVSVFNSGHSIFASCFCECTNCVNNESSQTIYTVSEHKITILSAEICNNNGILVVKESGCVVSPKTEIFKSANVCGNVLSASTNRGIYFIDCHVLHTDNLVIVLEETPCRITDTSCHSWRGNHIAIGTLSGKLYILNSEFKEIFQTIVKHDSAIYSVDWKDEYTIVIGGVFPKIFSVDLRDPHMIETEVSVLASLPRVKWGESLKSILFADAENHGRRLEKHANDPTNHLHQPIGTFDSMIHDMATSPNHNILASACASGSIHMAWMSDETNHGVEFEKRIFSINQSDDGRASLISTPEYVTFQVHDTIKLYPSNQACTSVTWCPNPKFPGLLAAGYRNGMIVLIVTDRYFI